MHNIWTYFCFEFKNILKSKGLISVVFIAPFIYGFFYPQPYLNEVMRHIPIAVVDQDQSLQSRQLIRDLNATDTVKVTEQFSALLEAETALKSESIFGILVIPPHFEQDVISGKPTALPFYGDASYILIYNNMATAVNTSISTLSSTLAIQKQIAQGVDPAIAKASNLAFTPTMIPLFNPQSGYATYILPPAFALILHQLLFMAIVIYSCLYRQQERVFLRTQIEPTRFSRLTQNSALLIGKWITYLCLYSFFYWLYFIFIHFLYDIPNLASFLTHFVFDFIYLSATIFFALACSTFIKKIEAVFLIYVPISLILFFLSGVSWPDHAIFKPLVWLSHFVPAVIGMPLSAQISQMGSTISTVSGSLCWLLGLTIFYFLFSLWRAMQQK